MTVRDTKLEGVFVLQGVRFDDVRGDFRRLFDMSKLPVAGIDHERSYVASAYNVRAGTVRGLHYQVAPCEETKILWCHSGSMYDVLVDVRPTAATYGRWISIELSAARPEVVCVPAGVAHGYQTTSEGTGVTYLISGAYEPSCARTIHWRDETLAIPWPLGEATVSEDDASAPRWDDTR